MATTSGDLQLYKPQYSESADVAKINDNMEIIDDAFTEMSGQTNGIAIVVDGDTAPRAIASGAYLFIKNHSTLPTGGYHATAAIANGANVTSGNVAADADGIVNGAFSALNSKIANIDKGTYIVTLIMLVANDGYARAFYDFIRKDVTYTVTLDKASFVGDSTDYKNAITVSPINGRVMFYSNDATFVSAINTLNRPINATITVS